MLVSTRSGDRSFEIEFFRRQHGRCVLKLRGLDSITEAENYIGAELRIPLADLLPPDEGSFYTFQLKGCSVFDGEHYLGKVSEIQDLGGTEILKVDLDDQETLIPFASAFLKNVDLTRQRIDVNLPEGLRDLNK